LLAKIDTLLFDLDGTLVDSIDLIVEGFHRIWEQNFSYRPEREDVVKTIGVLIDNAMHQLIDAGIRENRITIIEDRQVIVKRLLDEYREYYIACHDEMIRPFPGVNEMLSELRQRGYRIGVVTSKRRMGADRSLKVFGMDALLDCVVAAEDTDLHKPHPDPILKGMEMLDSASQRTAYIGDSTHDMIAGKRAGVFTVAALWGPFDPDELKATEPSLTAVSPMELLNCFAPM
jgi:pyrophosphatase PpaX